ncbi:TPA: DUF551 domain-containing protein [Serratia marcescens]
MKRTLTTEQLRARAKFWREKAVEAKWESVSIAQDMLLNADAFDELAANREEQPVAWEIRYWNSGHNCWHDWERITAEQHAEMSVQHAADSDYEFRVLYDAPPAPAAPEAIITAPIDAMRCGPAASYVLGWNACRAAMLAQPVSGGYKLPEGWIACSERMPDNDETKPIAIYTGKCLGQGMFVATYDEDGFFDYWEGGEIIGVTHWMPLPAAPEGGNDHDTRR